MIGADILIADLTCSLKYNDNLFKYPSFLSHQRPAVVFDIITIYWHKPWNVCTVRNWYHVFCIFQMEIDNISDIGEWQTWPGWLILVFRIAIMIWFLFELRETVVLERSKDKTRFYLHFGAGYLVWFVYLPIIAVICTQISSLWRYKTLISEYWPLPCDLMVVILDAVR